MVNIILAFRSESDAEKIRVALVRSGYPVRAILTSGIQAIRMMDALGSGILITSYQLSDMIYEGILRDLPRDFRMILMAKESRLASLQDNDVVCLPYPVKLRDLTSTLDMLETQILESQRRRKRPSAVPKRTQEEEAIIREAKNILMSRNNMTEKEAHRYLQKNAMDTGMTFVKSAMLVIETSRE